MRQTGKRARRAGSAFPAASSGSPNAWFHAETAVEFGPQDLGDIVAFLLENQLVHAILELEHCRCRTCPTCPLPARPAHPPCLAY